MPLQTYFTHLLSKVAKSATAKRQFGLKRNKKLHFSPLTKLECMLEMSSCYQYWIYLYSNFFLSMQKVEFKGFENLFSSRII